MDWMVNAENAVERVKLKCIFYFNYVNIVDADAKLWIHNINSDSLKNAEIVVARPGWYARIVKKNESRASMNT
jgi:hypothetical protein